MYAGEIVERGPSEDLTQRPAHPYSQLLLAAAPDPDRLGAPVEERLLRGSRQASSALVDDDRLPLQPALPVLGRPLQGGMRRLCVRSARSEPRPAGGSTSTAPELLSPDSEKGACR